MKGSPFHRNYGIGSPAKQAKPDVEGEKKVMDKRKKAIEDHRKNAPKTTNTQEQADQLNAIQQANIDAHNTSNDSIQNVHNLYRADIEKQNAVIDSTNTANKAAYDKYIESTKKKKKKSPAKQLASPAKQGDVSDLSKEELNAMPKELFNNPHGLGGGGNKKVIENLNRDDYRAWYKKTLGGAVSDTTDHKYTKSKSPAKCPLLALAPAAIAAVGAMKKNKEE